MNAAATRLVGRIDLMVEGCRDDRSGVDADEVEQMLLAACAAALALDGRAGADAKDTAALLRRRVGALRQAFEAARATHDEGADHR